MNSFFHSVLGGGGRRYEMGAGSSTMGGAPFGMPGPGDFPGNRARRSSDRQRAQQQHHRPPEQRAAPPASRRAIRQLPTVVVTPEDLVDENNRECCICLDENCLKDRVIRLPCAHIYHPRCIVDWLLKHCTCPVCRYELPTDDASYEKGRVERMRSRKPRYARYELDRMSGRELRALASRLNVPGGTDDGSVVERGELIRTIVESGKIEVISAPEPVEYGAVAELRAMGVGKLRRAMEAAGVFFDPIDVVEKEDMVQIFVQSGRVVFREEEVVEETAESEVEGKEERGGGNSKGECDLENGEDAAAKDASSSLPKSSDDDAPMEVSECGVVENMSQDDAGSQAGRMEEGAASQASAGASATEDGMDIGDSRAEPSMEHTEEDRARPLPTSSPSARLDNDSAAERSGAYPAAAEPSAVGTSSHAFASRTVAELRALGRAMAVDLSTCIEKREMVERLAARASATARR